MAEQVPEFSFGLEQEGTAGLETVSNRLAEQEFSFVLEQEGTARLETVSNRLAEQVPDFSVGLAQEGTAGDDVYTGTGVLLGAGGEGRGGRTGNWFPLDDFFLGDVLLGGVSCSFKGPASFSSDEESGDSYLGFGLH